MSKDKKTLLAWRLFSLFIMLALSLNINFGGVSFVSAAKPNYIIGNDITAEVIGAFELSISGSATAFSYVGQESAQHISIDWGDSTQEEFDIQNDSRFITNFSDGNFTTSWTSIPHIYTTAGTVTIVVKVHHANWNGKKRGGISEFNTNVFIPEAVLNVIKIVNGGDLIASDFFITVGGTNVSPESFPGSENGTIVSLDPGEYWVVEAYPSGGIGDIDYDALFSSDCLGTISSGETKICTITNTFAGEVPPSGGGGGGGGPGGGN